MLYQLSYTPQKRKIGGRIDAEKKRGRPLFFSSYSRGAALYEARTAEQAKKT